LQAAPPLSCVEFVWFARPIQETKSSLSLLARMLNKIMPLSLFLFFVILICCFLILICFFWSLSRISWFSFFGFKGSSEGFFYGIATRCNWMYSRYYPPGIVAGKASFVRWCLPSFFNLQDGPNYLCLIIACQGHSQ
jgi:hypothetical protein